MRSCDDPCEISKWRKLWQLRFAFTQDLSYWTARRRINRLDLYCSRKLKHYWPPIRMKCGRLGIVLVRWNRSLSKPGYFPEAPVVGRVTVQRRRFIRCTCQGGKARNLWPLARWSELGMKRSTPERT